MIDFISYIKENKNVAVVGPNSTGKTMLLKMLFKSLQGNMVVLFCETDDVTGKNTDNIIKGLVNTTYGESAYSAFQQMPSSCKAIIIDDLQRISPKHLNRFLRGIEKVFDIIIVSTDESPQFDIVQTVKEAFQAEIEFKKVSISKLYAEKRLEVIQKIVALKSDCNSDSTAVARTLEQCLNSYKLAFRVEIDFVVQYADYYCSHMGELDKADATVFSKVFESSIEREISPHLIQGENANDFLVALSEVAYYVHFNKEYPISAEHINVVVTSYCSYYDNRYLDSKRFLDIAEKSGLLIKLSSGYEYRFKSRDHLAYFVAKALNRKYHDDGDDKNLRQIVEQSCFGINGDILMFLTYISDNVKIIRLLLSQAETYIDSWSEFDLNDNKVKYLKSIPSKKLSAPNEDEKSQNVADQAAAEEELHDNPIDTLDIYDYDDTKIDMLNYQLIRAVLQLRIIARSLSAFISILPAQDKRRFVFAMYQSPNKIFAQWSESVDNNLEQLIEDIMRWQDSPDYVGKKLTREEALAFFQDISLDMLLNLYYTVSSYGASNITIDYIANQDYVSSSLNYRIERLMFYEKVDDYQSVIKEAEIIFNKYDDCMTRNLIIAILRHTIVYSDRITDKERRRLISTYFSPNAQKNILIDRKRAILSKNV